MTPEEEAKLEARKGRIVNGRTYQKGKDFDAKHIQGQAEGRNRCTKAAFETVKYKKLRPARETSPGVFESEKGARNWSCNADFTTEAAKKENKEDICMRRTDMLR